MGTVVLVEAARGVTVGVGVFFLGVELGVAVGEVGGPSAIVIWISENPAAGGGAVTVELLPPPQLSRIAPNTNSTTGETTSHLSHHDIKSRAMTSPMRGVKAARQSIR